MSKNKSVEPKPASVVIFRGLTPERYKALMDTLKACHGEEIAENMTLLEVQARHKKLTEVLDGKRQIGDLEIPDDQMNRLTDQIEAGTERRKILEVTQQVALGQKKRD